jgi:hypothetical protein
MINQEVQTRLDDYVRVLEEIKKRVANEQTASIILQEIAKDVRMAQIQAERFVGRAANASEPATEKQIAYLKNLGVDVPENLTKLEASAMLDRALAAPGPRFGQRFRRRTC